MFGYILAFLLLGLSLLGISLRKTYYYLPPKELKRQAEAGDKLARTLWKAVAYDASLRALLWLWIGLTAAGGFVLLAKVAPPFIAFIATALLLWMAFAWYPRRSRLTGAEARLTRIVTPSLVWLLNYVHPVLDRTVAVLARRYPHEQHTNVYETEDLLEVVRSQRAQTDNRIAPEQLEAVERALTAHHYKVSDVLTPRSEVKTVKDTDIIGLVLLDELHKSGQTIFPVVKSGTDKTIGALYLDDLNLKTEGKVHDYMQHNVHYLHEDDSLKQALQAFFKTKHQLFVVINSFEEYVGIVTLEHVMQQLTGHAYEDSFDQHHDLSAVANKHAHDDDEPEEAVESEVSDVQAEPEAVTVPVPESAEPADVSPVEHDLVMDDPDFDEVAEVEEGPKQADEDAAFDEVEPVEDKAGEPEATEEPAEELNEENPDELAALDLPEEDEHDTYEEGSHVTFKKNKKSKAES